MIPVWIGLILAYIVGMTSTAVGDRKGQIFAVFITIFGMVLLTFLVRGA